MRLLSVLSRLEHQYKCRIYPLYVSTLGGFYCGVFSRLSVSEIEVLAINMDHLWDSTGKLPEWLLMGNLPRQILVLPDDLTDRRDFCSRLAEKRNFRQIPRWG